MKKISILFLLALVCSCSNSDDSGNFSNSDFHPPVWIQGVWIVEGSAFIRPGFIFTDNDLCYTQADTRQCQQEQINLFRQVGNNTVVVSETFSSTTYKADIKYSNGQASLYSFRKLSDNSIEWTALNGSIFIKQ